jgi:hypothetical protein
MEEERRSTSAPSFAFATPRLTGARTMPGHGSTTGDKSVWLIDA